MADSASPMVVFRVGKLKTLGNIGGAAAHNARLRPTENARPASAGGKFYEVVDRGGKSVVDRVREIHADIADLCKKNKWYQRPDQVAAAEIICSASPEYFRPGQPERYGYYEQDKLDAWLSVQIPWLEKEVGAKAEIVSMVVHLDEATPHIQVICVPRNHRGELSYRAVFGSDDRGTELREWQTRAAEPVAPLGIIRGIPGSTAKHQNIRDYYAAVNDKPVDIPKIKAKKPAPLPDVTVGEKVPFTNAKAQRDEREQQHAQQTEAYDTAVEEVRDEVVNKLFPIVYQQAKGKAIAERDKKQAEQRAAIAESRLEPLKADAVKVRGLDLVEVLERMYGATEDADSKESYKSRKFNLPDGRKIGITGELWVEQGGEGGRNAINLVMHLEGYEQSDFKKAVRLLTDSFGSSAVVPEMTRHSIPEIERQVDEIDAEKVPAPPADPSRWPRVRKWLIEKRGLPAKLVEHVHDLAQVYADTIGNAVFPRQLGGAFLRGTGDRKFHRNIGMAQKCGPLVLPGKDATECWLCEAPVDALSIRAAFPDAHIIATGGNGVGAKLAASMVPKDVATVRLAYDNDAAGKKMATQITPLLTSPGRTVLRAAAPDGKDWNEAIVQRPELIAALWRDEAQSSTGTAPALEKAPTGPEKVPDDDDPGLPAPGSGR